LIKENSIGKGNRFEFGVFLFKRQGIVCDITAVLFLIILKPLLTWKTLINGVFHRGNLKNFLKFHLVIWNNGYPVILVNSYYKSITFNLFET